MRLWLLLQSSRGEIVYVTPSTGLKLEHIKRIGHVIAVAGGSSKAEAMLAVLSYDFPATTLVTDEGALVAMLSYIERRGEAPWYLCARVSVTTQTQERKDSS